MATKKAPPRRNTDVIRCENCGEEYSTTYKRCPFCDERPNSRSYPPVGGRRVAGGARSSRGGRQPNPLQVAGLVISLVLIIAAIVIVITTLSPLLFGNPSGGNSNVSTSQDGSHSSADNITLESLTLSRTEVALDAGEPFQLTAAPTPADAQVTVTWTSSDPDIATVDEYGNITNVYKGSDEVAITITASAGGQTATCTVRCTGDGTGENIVPSGGNSAGGSTSSGGALAPNTDAVITGATGGLNIRSGPGTDYAVQASTQDGATVTVLGDAGNGWYHIRYATGGGNFEEGYVMGEYLAPSPTQN